jgi:hypothetical protein
MEDHDFNRQIHLYNDKIQEGLNRGMEPNEIEESLSDLISIFTQNLETVGQMVEKETDDDWNADQEGYFRKIQQDIARIQIEKKLILAQLKSDIRDLDNEKEIDSPSDGFHVGYSAENEPSFLVEHSDKEYRLSWGMIMSGIAWGLEYDFDSSVPRIFRKRYLFEKAKYRINNLYQIQISKYLKSMKDDNPLGKSHISYQRLEDILSSGVTNDLDQGHKSEKIAESLLMRYASDYYSYFSVDPASVVSDVRFKSDFVLRREIRESAGRDETTVYDSVGIQWYSPGIDGGSLKSMNSKLIKTRRKLADTDFIKHGINAIKFVTSPFDAIKIFDRWANERPPFGPDVYIDQPVQIKILVQCLSGILAHEEIAEMLGVNIRDISSYDSESEKTVIDSIGDPIDTKSAILDVLASGDKRRIEKGLKNSFFSRFVIDNLQEIRDSDKDFVFNRLIELGYGQILLEKLLASKVNFNKDNLILAFDAIGKLDLLRPFYNDLGISSDDENRVTLTRALNTRF